MQFRLETIGSSRDGRFDKQSGIKWRVINLMNNIIIIFSIVVVAFILFSRFFLYSSLLFTFIMYDFQLLSISLFAFVIISFQNVYAKAIYDNIAESPDELAFKRGDLLTVIEQDEPSVGWWLCEFRGRQVNFTH